MGEHSLINAEQWARVVKFGSAGQCSKVCLRCAKVCYLQLADVDASVS